MVESMILLEKILLILFQMRVLQTSLSM